MGERLPKLTTQGFLALVFFLLCIHVHATSLSPVSPGGCGPPSPCGFAGVCTELPGPPIQHTCSCNQPFRGDDCSIFALGESVKIGTTIDRTLGAGKWDYFELQLPIGAPNYQESLHTKLDSVAGSCGFVLSDSAVQFFTKWQPEGYNLSNIYTGFLHFSHDTAVDLIQRNAIAVSVYAVSDCHYTGSFQINTNTAGPICTHGVYQDGLCFCSKRWAGPNCDKFSFPLVFTMAIAAGTFILGASIAAVMAGCLFRKRNNQLNVNSQGYEQYR